MMGIGGAGIEHVQHLTQFGTVWNRTYSPLSMKCQDLNLNSREEVLFSMTEPQVETLLAGAKAGNMALRDDLLVWVYTQALNYYCLKAQKVTNEGKELASIFVVHFEHRIDQIQTAVGWTRFMLANTHRWIKPKKSLIDFVEDSLLDKHNTRGAPPSIPHDVDDKKLAQYRIMINILENESEETRLILRYRLADSPLTYEAIAERLNMNPAAVRKRVQRFYSKVRKAWKGHRNSSDASL